MPDGSKKGGGLEVGSSYKMRNSALHMGAKHGTPIQKNYGKGMKFNAKLRAADLPEGKFKDAVDASGPPYASPAKVVTAWEKIKAGAKGVGAGISKALSKSSTQDVVTSTKRGVEKGKQVYQENIKKYDEN